MLEKREEERHKDGETQRRDKDEGSGKVEMIQI